MEEGTPVHRQTQDAVSGTWRLGNLSTPNSVQKLQTALHAKAKARSRLSLLRPYDKISREDILAHAAYAQCRSNKGAPGVDGQDFADIEAYGVERWLAELALAPQEEDLPTGADQTRVHTEGQRQNSRPLGISTVRDRVWHDSSDAGVGPDLRSRSSTGTLLPIAPGEMPSRR